MTSPPLVIGVAGDAIRTAYCWKGYLGLKTVALDRSLISSQSHFCKGRLFQTLSPRDTQTNGHGKFNRREIKQKIHVVGKLNLRRKPAV